VYTDIVVLSSPPQIHWKSKDEKNCQTPNNFASSEVKWQNQDEEEEKNKFRQNNHLVSSVINFSRKTSI